VRVKEKSFEAGLAATFPIEIARFYAVPFYDWKRHWRAMMHRCIALAAQPGKDVTWLGVWEHNQRAINFYTAFGFKKFGEHGFLLGDNVQRDWLMHRVVGL